MEGYWIKVLQGSGIIKEHIGADDEALMKCIEDISVIDEEDCDNFTIVFTFGENEFISNKELVKKFFIKSDAPTSCESTKIEWKGKNMTTK